MPEGIGPDPETTEALLRVDQVAPNPPTELGQLARDEFEQLLADVLSVEQREGNTVPPSQLLTSRPIRTKRAELPADSFTLAPTAILSTYS